ncbi:hypothetical protein PV04_02035 [Phialophora macrospora]|uniref:Clr5 domain-containing protein n=1 Tax=Phialophora macrospora TaxID=1851006 RepID=A0A0D2D8S5_9EURO|nr:hypothetical protein PV04_02035 [Phialophora macrospora]
MLHSCPVEFTFVFRCGRTTSFGHFNNSCKGTVSAFMSTKHRSNPRAPPIPKAAWDRYRPAIELLYRGHELTDVIKRMKCDHDFHATDKQYKRQFARWGIRKNVSSKEMEDVLGKPMEDAIIRGVQVPKSKITRFERRQRLKASAVNPYLTWVQRECLSSPQR